MSYARVDRMNRIIEWSEEHLNGFDVEFDNGDYVNQTCVNGSEDFVIRNRIAYYEPLPHKEIEQLQKQLAETDYINYKLTENMVKANNSLIELSEVLKQHQEKYGELIQQRQQWRDRINELEKAMKV